MRGGPNLFTRACAPPPSRCGGVVALESFLFPPFFCLSAPLIFASLSRANTLI